MNNQDNKNNEVVLLNNKYALTIITIILCILVGTSCIVIGQTVKYINSLY